MTLTARRVARAFPVTGAATPGIADKVTVLSGVGVAGLGQLTSIRAIIKKPRTDSRRFIHI